MKTVLEKSIRDELIARINSLNKNSSAAWGKMNVYQMLKHCAIAEESYLGKKEYKRILIGRLIGKKVLKNILKDVDDPARIHIRNIVFLKPMTPILISKPIPRTT